MEVTNLIEMVLALIAAMVGLTILANRLEESNGEFGHLSRKEAELQRKALDTERSKIMELHIS